MGKSSYSSGRGTSPWTVLGWVFLVVLGVGLVWVGFAQPFANDGEQDTEITPSSIAPTLSPVLYPTFTPLPTVPIVPAAPTPMEPTPATTDPPATAAAAPTEPPPTPEPTQAPAAAASLVAGEDGVNVRGGPGTNYTLQGYLEPGTKAEITGRYSDWWQIRHGGELAWVFGDLVSASNADTVPQVEPPPAPTAAPATAAPAPTTAPPTATSAPAADYHGLRPDKFEVEGAPGPYSVGQSIWFNMWITNLTSQPVEYEYLGVQVEETGVVQKSWTYSEFDPNQNFYHRDQMHDKISAPGTYHLWMVVEFRDGTGFRLLGPIEIVVQ